VELDDTAATIKGRLVSLEGDTVVLLVKDDRVTLPKDRVIRVRTARDFVRNGAYIGALIGVALCARNCGQGLDSAGQLPLAVASTAGVWGAAGAGIDALIHHEKILYERGRTPSGPR
jgi:hypothetical protein